VTKELFEFDRLGEMYWEKIIKFLRVYFQRSQII